MNDKLSESEVLNELIENSEANEKDKFYDAKLVSALMLQFRGKVDSVIENRLGIKLKPEHKKEILFEDPTGNNIKLTWLSVPSVGFKDEIADMVCFTQSFDGGKDEFSCEFKASELMRFLDLLSQSEDVEFQQMKETLDEIGNVVVNRISWLVEIGVLSSNSVDVIDVLEYSKNRKSMDLNSFNM